jgi:hypothetical protein
MTDERKVDASDDDIAVVCRNLTDDRSSTGYDRWFIADLLSALHARALAAEKERDEATFAMTAAMQRVSYLETSKLGFVEALDACNRGLELWKDKPYNAKWWKRIDGTPIPNNLLCCIAEILGQTANADRSQRDAAVAELAQVKAGNESLRDAAKSGLRAMATSEAVIDEINSRTPIGWAPNDTDDNGDDLLSGYDEKPW